MNRSLRSLLRHIALGTPLVLAPGGVLAIPTLLACGQCHPSPIREEYTLSADELSGGETISCEAICAARDARTAGCTVVDAQTVSCETHHQASCGAGRLPRARARRESSGSTEVARRWLLETATLELSAVAAFRELARDLAAHDAPSTLIARADDAASDEVRHARALIALAGPDARVSVRVRPAEIPTLFALAAHNAREGCVHEALGAIEAAHQAVHAPDAALRSAMAAIARDEARHALLSLDLDVWARSRLMPMQRRALDEIGARAEDELTTSLVAIPEVGLADRRAHAALLRAA